MWKIMHAILNKKHLVVLVIGMDASKRILCFDPRVDTNMAWRRAMAMACMHSFAVPAICKIDRWGYLAWYELASTCIREDISWQSQ